MLPLVLRMVDLFLYNWAYCNPGVTNPEVGVR